MRMMAMRRRTLSGRGAERLVLGDHEAKWTAVLTEEGAIHVDRLWRGVVDHHVIEAAFVTSAEARKLARLAGEQADVYTAPAYLVKGSGTEEVVEAETASSDDDDGEEEHAAQHGGVHRRAPPCCWPGAGRRCWSWSSGR